VTQSHLTNRLFKTDPEILITADQTSEKYCTTEKTMAAFGKELYSPDDDRKNGRNML
jgi:hypothetical protein